MKFGFVTSVQLGLAVMEIEAVDGHLDLVLTLHDDFAASKSGRVHVDDFCRSHGARLIKIRHNNDHDSLASLEAADLDWLFITGWSQIAGPGGWEYLGMESSGCTPRSCRWAADVPPSPGPSSRVSGRPE